MRGRRVNEPHRKRKGNPLRQLARRGGGSRKRRWDMLCCVKGAHKTYASTESYKKRPASGDCNRIPFEHHLRLIAGKTCHSKPPTNIYFTSMKRGFCIQALVLLVCCVQLRLTAPADDSDEKPRAYQFGFNIGTQHREEKKDENGIVTGEYGFLTADGYYNIVMYATDIEGRFIITGRKRIRVEPPKPKPDEAEARKARAKEEEAAAKTTTTTTTTTTTERVKIYHFNYTAPQHGREEMGFSDSSKMGDYYWDGPDGYRRIVTYNADDARGYRPVVKQVKLPVP